MATLEKIRSKSVFLIVVIGVALLAFIVGDALTNSRNLFGDHTTVAKVGKTKIDYTDYQRKREELNNQLEEARRTNPSQVANFDTQILPQLALNQLIQETMIAKAADKAGIRASSNLLSHYMLENPQSREVMNIVQQLNASGLSVQTPAQAYEIIFNPTRNGLTTAQMEPFQRLWLRAENEMKKNLAASVYQRLVYGTVKANDLDKKALYNDYVATSGVDMAFKPFGVLDPEKYPVSDSDLKKAYDEKKKALFATDEPTKQISFIAVNIAPSSEDRENAHKLALRTVKEYSDSARAISKELKKEGLSVEHFARRAADLPAGQIKDYVLNAPADSVRLISETLQGFTVVKMGKRTVEVDSVELSIVGVASDKLADKVLAALNGGLLADSLATRFPADSVVAQPKQWLPLYTADGPTNLLPSAQMDSLMKSPGYMIINASADGAMLAKVTDRKQPVTIYDYEVASYVLGPSVKTVNDERARLEKFLSENNNAKAFVENAAKAGFNIMDYTLTQSDPAVPRMPGMNQYFPDSRQVVRWVMINGKPGDVSSIYESKNAVNPLLYAAAVNEAYDDYVPMSNQEVRGLLTDQVRRQKAGQDLQKEYAAKAQTVESAAKAMGVEPRTMSALRFGRNSGVADPAIAGQIAGTPANKKVMVVAGEDGIYVYQVNAKNEEKFPYNESQYEQQYFQLVNPNFLEMVEGNAKTKNNIYKFEAGE